MSAFPDANHSGIYDVGDLRLPRALVSPGPVHFVLGALARRPESAALDDETDRARVHLRLTLDAPQPDRVHVDALQRNVRRSFREVLAELRKTGWRFEADGLSPWVAAIHGSTSAGFEDLDAAEMFARCIVHYDGIPHAMPHHEWVKREFRSWNHESQANFAHLFIDWYDRDWYRDLPGIPAALVWLESKRRFLKRWTVELRDKPEPPSDDARHFEPRVYAALAEAKDALVRATEPPPPNPQYPDLNRSLWSGTRQQLLAEVAELSQAAGPIPYLGLDEAQKELGLPGPARWTSQLVLRSLNLAQTWTDQRVEGRPELDAAFSKLQRAAEDGFGWSW
ncbi:MAG: hypothetical protein JST54_05670 [Deltaproteobacteria bacterium]|nr:hypothetical protein [Deltaproteobacteria bacterium]